MNGMEMMLKSIGLDPQILQQSLAATVQAISSFDGRLVAIERSLDGLMRSQKQLVESIEKLGEQIGRNNSDIRPAGESNWDLSGGTKYCAECGGNIERCLCVGRKSEIGDLAIIGSR